MALTDFSVTVSDVLEKLPLDTSQISATTEPVSTTDIEGYVQDASSELRAVLDRAAINIASINDDTKRQMQSAVEAYAVAEALDAMGVTGRQYDKYRDKWRDVYDRYTAQPSALATSKSRVKSNIDTGKTTSAEFVGTGYEF